MGKGLIIVGTETGTGTGTGKDYWDSVSKF